MQNIAMENALQLGYLELPFSPLVTHGFLDLADFAAVAAAILRARPSMHARTRYELVGDIASYRDVTKWLSECACMPITIERVDRDTAVQRHFVLRCPRERVGQDTAVQRQVDFGLGRSRERVYRDIPVQSQVDFGLKRSRERVDRDTAVQSQVDFGLGRSRERVDQDTPVQCQVDFGLGRLRDAYGCDALARMISYYEEQYVRILPGSRQSSHKKNYSSGLTGSVNTLRWLLGRDPMSVKRYIAREADLILSAAARDATIMS